MLFRNLAPFLAIPVAQDGIQSRPRSVGLFTVVYFTQETFDNSKKCLQELYHLTRWDSRLFYFAVGRE